MSWKSLGTIGGALAGALAGAAVAGLAARDGTRAAPAGRAPVAQGSVGQNAGGNMNAELAGHEGQIRALQAQVLDLQSRAMSTSAEGGVSAPTQSPAVTETPEAAAARFRAYFEKEVTNHNREPTDPSWAPKVAGSLSDDFTRLAGQAHYHFEGVDCRTTSCLAEVTFDNYSEARQHYQQIMHHIHGPNCAITVFTPPPQDPAARYRSEALLDCTESRAQ